MIGRKSAGSAVRSVVSWLRTCAPSMPGPPRSKRCIWGESGGIRATRVKDGGERVCTVYECHLLLGPSATGASGKTDYTRERSTGALALVCRTWDSCEESACARSRFQRVRDPSNHVAGSDTTSWDIRLGTGPARARVRLRWTRRARASSTIVRTRIGHGRVARMRHTKLHDISEPPENLPAP